MPIYVQDTFTFLMFAVHALPSKLWVLEGVCFVPQCCGLTLST